MGDLFIVRNVSPDEIEKMDIFRLKYWHKWHGIADSNEKKFNKEERDKLGLDK